MLSLYRRGGGQVVSVVIFYSNDLSLNPAEVFIFCSKLLEKNERNEKEFGVEPFKMKFLCGCTNPKVKLLILYLITLWVLLVVDKESNLHFKILF